MLLEWEFIDFDQTIERAQNQRIAEIFREHGEPYFRALEAELTERVAKRRNVVLAPGGGWVTQAELVTMLHQNSLIVWLRARPETVYQRDLDQSEVERPLLSTDDPLTTIRSLLDQRTPLYDQADVGLDTDGRKPIEIAAEIEMLTRR